MSLFHVQEWYQNIVSGARTMTVAQMIDYRDQLIVGSLEGILSVVDPGRDLEHRQEMAVIAEIQLSKPVLQVITGKFLSGYDQLLIAALHPRSLVYFRLVSNDEESYKLEQIFEHKLQGDSAFNMCQGHFGRSHITQICVQSLSCALSIFEGENRVLHRRIPDCVHPGPIDYTSFSESMLLASGGYLTSIRYSVLTTAQTGQSKKLNPDWSLNLGDTALDLTVIGVLPIQPSIVVLCRRVVYCITHGGTPRFMIRLQCVAMCMMIYNSNRDAGIQICVGTSTSTLLFYHDTKMLWSAQLQFVPVYINISSFNESLRCLLSILSDDSKVFIGYLGTEPSLYRMPVTESRFIDFEERKSKMREYEETIWKHSRDNPESKTGEVDKGLQLKVDLNMDSKSMAYDTNESVPSATAIVTVQGLKDQVDILFQGDIFAHRTNFSFTSREMGNIPITMFVRDRPVLDPRCQIVAISNNAEIVVHELALPLQLICNVAPPLRTSTFKISIDSTMASVEVGKLFPEFEQESQSGIAFQPFGSPEATVSLFVSAKTNRYRIQSDSTDFFYVIFAELVKRIQKHQPDVKLHCPVPLHLFITAISKHIQLEQKRDSVDEDVRRLSIQMRHVETVLLGKLRSDREPFTTGINALINYTYKEIMTGLDKLLEIDSHLNQAGRRPLRALINLMYAVLELADVCLPFDGRILDGTDQKFSERITYVLSTETSNEVERSPTTEDASGKISHFLVSFCERGGNLSGIAEVDEDGEEDAEEREKKEETEKEEALNKAESAFEFVDLQTGSLPANFGTSS
ncbi:protein pthb1 like protein [Ditylenchus destructor]|uniref:Protein pthb1 like protein n=1 Tax=Ditylenchus destructor TaxID=166010 RepID=A0AAD4MSC3_9BILA|nr:protein pthb1 like protein [Ditylenchus destructor]